MLEAAHAVERISVLAFLVSSMLAVGCNLAPRAVVGPLRSTRLVILALALNFVLAPALAWVLTILIPLAQGHATGLLLLGGAAGAPFLPKVIEAAHGDVPSATALMILLTLGTILFMPIALPWLIPGLAAQPWAIARPLVLLIMLPLVIGMVIRWWVAPMASRIAPALANTGSASLALLFVLLILLNGSELLGFLGSGAIAAMLLYVIGLLAAGWLLGGPTRNRRGVLGLATAARNFGAALVPAGSFGDPNVTTTVIIGAIVCLIVSFLAAGWVRRNNPSIHVP